ncbi:hypothetical protein FJZ23_02045 [Candidatus Parcubacteria bacterium]|nr:hypothetical protein [Candidatus Parcubacteria bacterium]
MTFLCDNPWLFHRDEVDLLEEEMDDLYREHAPEEGTAARRMEQRVIQEQMETEERSDAVLEQALEGAPVPPDTHVHAPDAAFSSGARAPSSLREELFVNSERDPVYERLYQWVERVFAYTTKRYLTEGVRDEDVFRAHVNVKMVPIKFVSALTEFIPGDPVSEQVSETQRELCFVYFTRTLDSLDHRSFLGDGEAAPLVREGRELEELVRAHLTDV